MSAAECTVAKLQTFIQDLPETVHIAFGRAGYIYQVDGNNTLIKTAIELVRTICITLRVLYCQERAAAHAWVNIASLQFPHDLGGNIIRNHTFGSTFGS